MKVLTALLACVSIAILIFAGIIYSGIYDVSASVPHSGPAAWVLSTTMRESVTRRARGIEVPNLYERQVQLAGINDYDAMCTECHGSPSAQLSALALGLNPTPPDLVESVKRMTAAEVFWVTKHGVRMTGMPAWGESHSDDQLWPIVAVVLLLPELDADQYKALLRSAENHGHHAPDQAEQPAASKAPDNHRHDDEHEHHE